VRNDHTQQKSAKDGMDTNIFRRKPGQQQRDEHAGGGTPRQRFRVPPCDHATQEWSYQQEHQGDVGEGPCRNHESCADLGLRHADDKSEQTPRRHIVGRRTAQGDRAQVGPEHAAVGQNACQHRKRGDRHGHTHKQGEAHKWHVAARQPWIQSQRQQRPQHKRHQDARMGDGHGRMGAMPYQVGVELESDGEHIQEHAQLRNDAQKGGHRARQEDGRGFRSEERRPQHNTGDHFANDWRLPQVGTALGEDQPC
jgi:hypothetical protein